MVSHRPPVVYNDIEDSHADVVAEALARHNQISIIGELKYPVFS